jgi:hypothetical protein
MNPAIQIAKATNGHLSEFYDGYAFVGFTAGSNEPVIIIPPMDSKSAIAVTALLGNAIVTIQLATRNPSHGDDS